MNHSLPTLQAMAVDFLRLLENKDSRCEVVLAQLRQRGFTPEQSVAFIRALAGGDQ